ncbi:hypothetical protein K1719_042971 [Acacia pycnantha]|nr:hypothetical protein K1719_042971 [Acacia pycnantha]
MTVIIVSHSIKQIQRIADLVCLLVDGQIGICIYGMLDVESLCRPPPAAELRCWRPNPAKPQPDIFPFSHYPLSVADLAPSKQIKKCLFTILGYGIKKLDGRYYQGHMMQMTMMATPSINKELHYLNKEDRLLTGTVMTRNIEWMRKERSSWNKVQLDLRLRMSYLLQLLQAILQVNHISKDQNCIADALAKDELSTSAFFDNCLSNLWLLVAKDCTGFNSPLV